MTQLASNVRRALADGMERRPFTLTVVPAWPDTDQALFGADDARLSGDAVSAPLDLHGTLNRLTPAGQIIYRYARPSARDYLSAWLAHLVYCAVGPVARAARCGSAAAVHSS